MTTDKNAGKASKTDPKKDSEPSGKNGGKANDDGKGKETPEKGKESSEKGADINAKTQLNTKMNTTVNVKGEQQPLSGGMVPMMVSVDNYANVKKVVGQKCPGWAAKANEKYMYTDKNVQELIKDVPGVGEEIGCKVGGKDGKDLTKTMPVRIPKHKAKIQFKLSDALQKEALKVDEMLNKMTLKDTEPSNKVKEKAKN